MKKLGCYRDQEVTRTFQEDAMTIPTYLTNQPDLPRQRNSNGGVFTSGGLSRKLQTLGLLFMLSALVSCGGGAGSVPVSTSALPVVTSISPLTAVVNTPVQFVVTGSNLPLSAEIAQLGLACDEPTTRSSSGFMQICTYITAGSVQTKVMNGVTSAVLASYQIQVDPQRYVKVCNTGASAGVGNCPTDPLLGAGATQWACVIDLQTNKMWEVKTSGANGAPQGLRDWMQSYTNYDDITKLQKIVGSTVVAPTVAEISASSNSVGLVNALNGLVGSPPLCGSKKWRVPTLAELKILVVGTAAPTINTQYFPNTANSNYLTSTPQVMLGGVVSSNSYSVVSFNTGSDCCFQTRSNVSFARLISEPPPPVLSVPLNDTGIGNLLCFEANNAFPISCTSAGAIAFNSNQDGMVGVDVDENYPSDGKTGFSFGTLPNSTGANYSLEECVQDNRTGLVWEGKTTTGGIRDVNHTLNGVAASGAYLSAANNSGLCGFNDWRLPNVVELQSIVDYGNPSNNSSTLSIDTNWFANTKQALYMTGDFGSVQSTFIEFKYGQVRTISNTTVGYIRLVRGGDPDRSNKLTFNGNEVFDASTGLTWRRCNEGKNWNGTACVGTSIVFSNFTQAFTHAQAQTGWRVPNIKELVSVTPLTGNLPYFGDDNLKDHISATPCATCTNGSPGFWRASMSLGGAKTTINTSGGDYLKLVK